MQNYRYLREADSEEREVLFRQMLIESIQYGLERKGKSIEKEDAGIIADFLISEDYINFGCCYQEANEHFEKKYSKDRSWCEWD
jgi:hypothetical protein